MKIIILLSAGILLLAIILISWRFGNSADDQSWKGKKEVTIHLKAVIENGKKRLELSDSNGNTAKDHLITEVAPGAKIIWIVKTTGKIKKIDNINPKIQSGVIFKNGVVRINDKKIELIVPDNVKSGTQEAYYIEFTHIDQDTVIIDPYIRIED